MTEKQMTPLEFEQKLLNQVNSQTEGDPLDVHAAMFKMFNPRFQGQVNHLSKKELLKLVTDLCGAKCNDQISVNQINGLSKDLGLKALRRVIGGVVEHPLADKDLKLTIEKEVKLFILIDSLLTNKFYTGICQGLTNPDTKLELHDVIVDNFNTNDKEFQKLKKVQKDAFITGKNLLHSKYWMMLITQQQYLDANPEIKKQVEEREKNNGR